MKDKLLDLVIIGAGPSALTAAVYTSREGINTILYEKGAVGGLAAITDMIDNYPGFPDGIAGYEIASLMQKQAERFGAEIKYGEVTEIKDNKKYKSVFVDGQEIKAKSLLIATGSSYRKIGVPGEAEYYGRGVHYCATCDGAFYSNKKAVVVGGGNSAVQEAMFLTRFANHIDLLVLGQISASEVLQNELKKFIKSGKISVHLSTATEEIIAVDNKVTSVKVIQSGKKKIIKTDGVFIFIGLKPNTKFLENSGIELDDNGFIKTNQKLETNLPGIFASGDVRSGATMQVASAVGEGATVAISIREYLAEI